MTVVNKFAVKDSCPLGCDAVCMGESLLDVSKEGRAFVFSGEAVTYRRNGIFNNSSVKTSNLRFPVLYGNAFTTVATGPNLALSHAN